MVLIRGRQGGGGIGDEIVPNSKGHRFPIRPNPLQVTSPCLHGGKWEKFS